jgi:hypothetical protein
VHLKREKRGTKSVTRETEERSNMVYKYVNIDLLVSLRFLQGSIRIRAKAENGQGALRSFG